MVLSDDEDDEINVPKKSPLSTSQKECANDNNNGNWMVNLFDGLYRQFVLCNALKIKQVSD